MALDSAASSRARVGDVAGGSQLFAEVLVHWRRVGNWTQQWTTVRNVVDFLCSAGADESAAVLLGGLATRTDATAAFGADARRLEQAQGALAGRLGASACDAASTRGAALGDDELVDIALNAVGEQRPPDGSSAGSMALGTGGIGRRPAGRG